jgi:signal transduction histidine kinase
MIKIRRPIFDRLSLGYGFAKEREALSLVYINYFIILIFAFVVILLHSSDEELVPVSYRYHGFIVMGLLELWFLKNRWVNLARVVILVVTPFSLLILPLLAGIFSDEFYFWFPYIPIGLSLIPHFILHTARHRIALIITLVIYLLLGVFMDNIMILLSDGTEKIIPIVIENRFYYKLIPVFIYVFVNVALGLLFAKNYRYEMIMATQQEDLVQAEKMASLGTLISGISHEINNPLNFISGSLHALNTLKEQYLKLEPGLSPEKQKIMQQIDRVIDASFEGVNRASDIISKLDLFSDPDLEIKEEIVLDQLLYNSLAAMESRIPYYIKLTTNIPRGMKVYCNVRQLRLVFSHILRNAIDALETKPLKERETITIIASEEKIDRQSYTRISFSNSGPAVPEKDLKQIFDPFFSSREAGEGVGLGMSISYRIIQRHGGRIEVSNQSGSVKFDILLPYGEAGNPKP